jgi:hypothetical protein
MKNVHLITKQEEGVDVLHQYLYITSEEAIKEGCYVFWEGKIYTYREFMKMRTPVYTDYFSIILTTDPELIANGVQSIDDEFLEWFVKNPSCERVEVELFPKFSNNLYGIIIPQGEPKQESHICKYCDAETTQPDDECYAKPAQYPLEDFIRRESKSGNESVGILKGVIWQSERIPSIIEEYLETAFISKEQGYMNPQKWFEQQKKK